MPQTRLESRPNVRLWQSLRLLARFASFAVLCLIALTGKVAAELRDGLDAYPPRWNLDSSDCQARVLEHKHLPTGGIDGKACEVVSFTATHGMQAIFAYPIEPVKAIDDLSARLSVQSARDGCRIGFRIRFPYQRDPGTRRALAAYIYGTSYENPGTFRNLGVGAIEKRLRFKKVAIRQELGAAADLRDPYVDAVVVNAFSGPGKTTIRLDELLVTGMVDVGQFGDVPRSHEESEFAKKHARRLPVDSGIPLLGTRDELAFPSNTITKILQYNGEPLSWVRSLGFDAVLLADPPDANILREAIQARIRIYAPPPTAPDPKLQSLLEPISAWYIGSGVSLDRRRVAQAQTTSQRLRALPLRWQRPIIAAPAEAWRSYAPMVDAMVDDLPMRVRGITAGEEITQMLSRQREVGDRIQTAVGITTQPPEASLRQTQSIARLIGAPPPAAFRWHAMWLQAMRSLESTPSAILFRSSRSLSSGTELDNQRSMAISYVNRMIAMVSPWVINSSPAPTVMTVGAPYRCGRLKFGDVDLLIASSTALRGNEVLAGDGQSLDLLLSPDEASKNVWRLTHFSAERMTPETTSTGARLQIISPDAVEIIVLSGDPSTGGKLDRSARPFAHQAGLDRWQLTSDLVRRTKQNWRAAIDASATRARMPADLINVATRTLNEAEPMFRAGDVDGSLRMARRADAWALRCQWQLSEALMPDWPNPTSSPPMHCDSGPIQIAWAPLMQDRGWTRNYLTTGSLDRQDVFADNRWTFGKLLSPNLSVDVGLAKRGAYQGGAMRAVVVPKTDDPLPGGYEGTVVQISSPAVKIPKRKAFRIDAMVRTIGFGQPHQGLLVYDTIGGQETGVLIRGRSDWTPVRLYRQAAAETDVRVMFEVIGAGEAMIDEVRLQIWDPKPEPMVPLHPIAEANESTTKNR